MPQNDREPPRKTVAVRPKDPRRAMRELGLAASAQRGLRIGFRIVLFALFFIAVYAFLHPGDAHLGTSLQVGDVARRTVVSDRDFSVIDELRTEEAKRQVAGEHPPIFEINTGVLSQITSKLDSIFLINSDGSPREATGEERLAGLLDAGGGLSGELEEAFLDKYYNYRPMRDALKRAMEKVYERKIVDSTEGFAEMYRALRTDPPRIGSARGGEIFYQALAGDFITMATARAELIRNLSSAFPGEDYALPREVALSIGNQLVIPTHRFSPAATRAERDKRSAQVVVREEKVKRGDVIVAAGQKITPLVRAKLNQYATLLERPWYVADLAWGIIVLAVVLAMAGFVRKYHSRWFYDNRFLTTLISIFLLTLGLSKLFDHVADRIPEIFGHLYFAVPVAMVGLMFNILISGRMALFIVNLISICIVINHSENGLLAGMLYVYYLCCGMVAIFTTRFIHKRSDLYVACLWISLCALVLAAAIIGVMNPFKADWLQGWQEHLIGLGWAAMSGAMAAMFTGFLLPAMESLLGLTTDLKLLEWSRKTPLIKMLEERAPATYQHTMTMCMLGEAAAEAIGANALEVRVGTLYHDIGKVERPEYFAENQVSKEQKMKHSKLQPSMSAKIIRNHVKTGLDMGREHGLPRVLLDYIPQHHGTMLITYFYERALQSDQHDSVREEDFRYPGPKPQRPETAIVMLADAVEAVSRTLNTTNEGEIKAMIRQIINDRFVDDQFDECALTLADLHKLGEAFAKSVRNMMHRRIEYPKPSQDRAEGKAVPL